MINELKNHQLQLKKCTLCNEMVGVPVHGQAVISSIMLIGQAPGIKEAGEDKPFAWTAGKTLFKWFNGIGVDEQQFRQSVYMTAVCRCFPGRKGKGGDRVPNKSEIKNCSRWLSAEINIIQPRLILLVGKLAINQVLPVKKLTDIIGTQISHEFFDHKCDFIALPHPSGASTWFRSEPGVSLLAESLQLIQKHSSWQDIIQSRMS
ncbi:MAG: uracil-DNA glycosylase family protein [Pseudomonadota bacterium]